MLPDITIDPTGRTPVLTDLDSLLTREELSALTAYLRRASTDARSAAMFPALIPDHDSHRAMCNDLLILRLEVRAVFLDRLAREA